MGALCRSDAADVAAARHAAPHPDAFWRGWRLLALDGTPFSLTNTPQITATLPNARTRRGQAAFVKITTTVLLELGLHNPLAAAIGRRGQSEWALAHGLVAQVPQRALVLADRLYGCAPSAAHLLAACQRVGSHLLVRVPVTSKPRVLKRLKDGSRLMRVPVREKHRRQHILQWLELREIRVHVGRQGHRPSELRVWTTLLDPRTAGGDVPVLRVSFENVLALITPMWLMRQLGEGLLTNRQADHMLTRAYALMRHCVTPPRRSRTCLRAVRPPMTRWPRLPPPASVEGPWHVHIV